MARRRRALSPDEQLQPDGLVVSVPVLVEVKAYLRQPPGVQAALRLLAPDGQLVDRGAFERLLREVLEWPAARIASPEILERLAVALPDLGVVLRPDSALLDREGRPL